MFEKFRKNVADTAKDLPKEDRKDFIEGVRSTEVYDKARAEHLEEAQMTQEKWAEHLKTQEELKAKREKMKQTVKEIQSKIDELKELGISTEELEAKLTEILEEKTENTVKINGKKVELGPTIEPIVWDEIQSKLDALNETIPEGEKPWRVPTKEEFVEIGKPLQKIWNSNLSGEEKSQQAKEYTEGLGFAWNSSYWSSTENADYSDSAWGWFSYNGVVYGDAKSCKSLVRLVR